MLDFFRSRTAGPQSEATSGLAVPSCRRSVPMVMSASPRVRSSTGFCLPLELEQEAQFIQKPIVRGRTVGGGGSGACLVLVKVHVTVWPALRVIALGAFPLLQVALVRSQPAGTVSA